MARVQKITTNGAFYDGRYIPKGFPVMVDPDELNGSEKNLIDARDIGPADVVEISAVMPTGPNPKSPQQVPPDARQTVEGHVVPGAILVGEVTADAETRLEKSGIAATGEAQAAVASALLDDGDDESVKPDPLDHDEDGKKGGSKAGDEATARKAKS
jgi:hypothetical protein